MIPSHEFWSRVDAALDERRDPLLDPEVQRLVAEEPGRLEELERLRERLDVIAKTPVRRRARRVAAAAAVISLASFAAWWIGSRESSTEPQLPRRELAIDVGPSRVLAFRATLSHESPRGVSTVELAGGTHTESWIAARSPDENGARVLSFIAAVSSKSLGIQP